MGELSLLFGKGLLFGVSIAAPVGPMALLVIRATLTRGFAGGFAAGLGIAAADGTYASMAAFGLQAVTTLLLEQRMWIAGLGGVFLVWFGLRTMLRPAVLTTTTDPLRLKDGAAIFARMYMLTMANPPTIMIFAALFASLGLAGTGTDWTRGTTVVVGVFLGSLGWCTGLAGSMAKLGGRLSSSLLAWINRISGTVLTGFGLWALSDLWR